MIVPPKALAEKAVKAMRIYLGSVDYVGVRAEQKFYKAAIRSVVALAKKTGQDEHSWWPLVEREARKRGAVRPTPGKDF